MTAETNQQPADFLIDWDFISSCEGGQRLDGYVPDATGSMSGVTIATGFDIGQRSRRDLERLGLSEALIDKLEPYCSPLEGTEAVAFLQRRPLTITEAEADQIDRASKRSALESLETAYNAASNVPFRSLPAEAQTVIASVAFQYGSLPRRTPTFWRLVTQQRWRQTIAELRDFGDSYPTRRRREAYLLENIPTNLPGRLSDEARVLDYE